MDLEAAKNRLFVALGGELHDERTLNAMERIPREAFIPPGRLHAAYDDIPIPIGEGQTISQPFIVALMISSLQVQPKNKVLDVGTGSGYQAAILSHLTNEVITVERSPVLAKRAKHTLHNLGFYNVNVLPAGEVLGCPEKAPFDAIVVGAGAPRLPQELLDQITIGGRLVIPIGSRSEQELVKVVRNREGYSIHKLGGCRFVPLIGKGAWKDH
jgi:protein-L-isoaspartate(D-aspartate) O-methyltransferase